MQVVPQMLELLAGECEAAAGELHAEWTRALAPVTQACLWLGDAEAAADLREEYSTALASAERALADIDASLTGGGEALRRAADEIVVADDDAATRFAGRSAHAWGNHRSRWDLDGDDSHDERGHDHGHGRGSRGHGGPRG